MYSSKEICYNDASCDCMFITDICNNNITSEYDSRFSDLIGYDPLTDPAVRDLENIIHQDDLEKFRKVKNSLSSGNPFDSINLRLIKKDRSVIYARCSFIYTTTDDNYERIIYAFSVLGDSEYYRQCSELIKIMQPLMFKFRQSEVFPFFYNDSFLKIIGYTREEADTLKLSYTDFMNSRDVDHFVHAIRSAGKSGTVCSCTVRILDKSGKTNWVSCSFRKMISSCGEDYFIGIGEDITEHKKTENELMKNRMLLKNLTDNLSCATFALNEDETKAELIRANQGFCRLFGYTDEELGKFRTEISEVIIHPDDQSDFIHGIMRTGTDSGSICRAITGNGRSIRVSFASFSTFEEERPCYMCTFHDITGPLENANEPEAVSSEPSVKPHTLVSADVFRALVDESLSSPSDSGSFRALYVLDLNGFMDISRKHGTEAGRKILNAVGEAILNLKMPSIAGKMYGDEFVIFVKNIKSYDDLNINAKQICSICRNIVLPDGINPESVSGCTGVSFAPLHGNDFETLYRKAKISLQNAKKFDRTRYAIYSENEVSDRRQLPYSEFTEKAAEIVTAGSGTYHLYTADIKHFRNINHSLGYEKGNQLLLDVCSMLQEFLKNGEYFTRLFGDNFLLLTHVRSPEEVAKRMDEINYRLQKYHLSESGEVQFAAGYVTIDDSNRSSEFAQLLDCSILAHQKAKQEPGTSFIRFEPGMSDEIFRKYEILSEISDAVKNGQICTFVQPQYDILNREYVSMEALVRWNHPVRGLLTPDSFIGICEENGIISSIDFCVLEQMCSFIRTRLDAGLRVLPVAVNQSQVTIHESDYVSRIISLVEKYSVPPEYIELEVTESACVNNLKETVSVLSELRKYGFRISMDDFGTGYSTLNYLKDIPVDSLKIDKEFLTENLVEKKPAEIIRAITGMAHNINIRVICEGVEFPQQVKFLENIGCELVQGFLFGRPMPYSDINEFMESSASAF